MFGASRRRLSFCGVPATAVKSPRTRSSRRPAGSRQDGLLTPLLVRRLIQRARLDAAGLHTVRLPISFFLAQNCLLATEHSLSPRSTQYTVFFNNLCAFQKLKSSDAIKTGFQVLKETSHFEALYNVRHAFAATLSPHLLLPLLSHRPRRTRTKLHQSDFFPPLSVEPDILRVNVEKLAQRSHYTGPQSAHLLQAWKKEFEPFFNMSGPSVVLNYMTGLRLALEQATARPIASTRMRSSPRKTATSCSCSPSLASSLAARTSDKRHRRR